MRPSLGLALALTAACHHTSTVDDTGSPADTGGHDTAADTAGDTAADTGHDTGDTGGGWGGDTAGSGGDTADSGGSGGDDTATADTGTPDTGADDTGTSTACTESDLTYTAEARDATGTAGTTFSTSDVITLAGVISNPCATDVDITFLDGCMVSTWSLSSSSGVTAIDTCAPTGHSATLTVPAGGSVEDTNSIGRKPAASYTIELEFFDHGTADTSFEVVR